MELPEAIRKELLDPSIWREGLERFATATKLAVLLTDTEGAPLGDCLNAQPTWSILRDKEPIRTGECPFCIQPSPNGGNCVTAALQTAVPVTTSDSCGLVHVAVPLFLFNQRIGALITGQMFDSYPNHLQLHNFAKKLNLSPERVWESARSEFPMRRETLRVYGKLLETLGNTFLQARYQSITDAEHLGEMTRLNDLSAQLVSEQRDLASERARQIEFTGRVLEYTRQELREVTRRLLSAQEEAQERMARELHDSIGQGIALFQFDIHALQQAIPNKIRQQLHGQFEAINNRICEIANQVRELSHELHPSVLVDLGLEEAVNQLGENLQKYHSLPVQFSAKDVPAVIDPSVSLGVYRIIQEALQNIVRHAGPAKVTITLIGGTDSLEASISDTGKGFEPNAIKRGLGLINMAQRAELLGGSLQLESHAGQGTTVCLRCLLGASQST